MSSDPRSGPARAGATVGPASLDARVLAERLRMIIAQTPQGIAAPAALALISAVVVSGQVARGPLVVVLALLAVTLAWWWAFYVRFRGTGIGAEDAATWARGTFVRTLCHGSIWGGYSVLIFPDGSLTQQSLDVAFMYGLVAGAVVVDGPHFPTFLAFALPTFLPVVARSFFEGSAGGFAVGAAGLVGLGHACFAALNASRITDKSIRTHFENLELVAELGRERELAERARADAEAANRAKSRFLASASHDLRQPVHALGLFAAAARQATTEDERRAILERIDGSLAALSESFDSLLEISRLDAGVLEPSIRTLPLRPILVRLEAEYAPAARAKALTFRLRCPELNVRTDPLLFERVVRNLVTNALRYTERGGVLLAARRKGPVVRVGVWDTGIGIPPDKQRQVFEEFYQLDNPERDRERGVGLGLAIVERIAKLLGARLHVRSRVGRGSCFAIDVPLAGLDDGAGDAFTGSIDADARALLGAVVVVIDDEATNRAALEVVLTGYGCIVVAAASGAEAIELIDARDAQPSVVISDYRLRGAETGIAAIAALREVHGAELPALLVTGDTAADRLASVKESGLEVLHKPVKAEELERVLVRLLA